MAIRDRIEKYRTVGGASDLVRVEVLVPPARRGDIVEHAAKLRGAHRSNETWSDEHEGLFQEAIRRFGARCLWNMPTTRTIDGLLRIASHLKNEGGMSAWALANRIKDFTENAARRVPEEDLENAYEGPQPR